MYNSSNHLTTFPSSLSTCKQLRSTIQASIRALSIPRPFQVVQWPCNHAITTWFRTHAKHMTTIRIVSQAIGFQLVYRIPWITSQICQLFIPSEIPANWILIFRKEPKLQWKFYLNFFLFSENLCRVLRDVSMIFACNERRSLLLFASH